MYMYMYLLLKPGESDLLLLDSQTIEQAGLS